MASVGLQQSFAQESEDKPDRYKIKINIVDVGEIDLGTGSFEMVFWTRLSSTDTDFTKNEPPEIDYVNAKEFTVITDRISDHEYAAKISGTFFVDNLDLHLYPHIEMDMKLKIEPAGQNIDEVVFIADALENRPVLIPGWNLHKPTDATGIWTYPDNSTNAEGETYSRYTATYPIDKPYLSSIIVGILPVLIMGIIAVITFLLDPIRQEFKAGVIGGILMAAVFFQVANIDQIPSLEYLTLEDKIITTFYGVLIVMMVELLAQWKYNAENNQEKAQKINKKFRIILPIVTVIMFVILNVQI